MATVVLDVNVLNLFRRLFADTKNKIHVNVAVQTALNKVIGDTPMYIIVADDDDDDYDFFSEAMHSIAINIEIERANNGLELINILRNENRQLPGIIFLDLNMPRMNGIECLEEIKKSDEWRDIPIIIYSTSANLEQVDMTYKSGANLYIQKPHDFVVIKNIIKKLFSYDMKELAVQPVRSKFLFRV